MQKFKRFFGGLVCLIIAFLIFTSLVYAQKIPHFIKYQGDIKKQIESIEEEKGEKEKDKGEEKDLYALTFRIYNLETDGVALWKETHLEVPVKKGEFEVILGSFTPLDLRFDEDYWLSVEIDSKGEIAPRERMTSFGYAYMSEDSYKLGGRYPDDFALFGHSHIGEDVVSPVAEAINADTVDGLHADQIGGIRDHGLLEGLADDDHLQYLNNVRGDERYAGTGWDGLTKLKTAQDHIADKNNPHLITLEQLGHLDNNQEEEAPTLTERGEPTGAEIQGWADDITAWGHSNLVMNLNADMIDGLHASASNNPLANTLIALDGNAKFPVSVIPSITEVTNADTVDSIHASVAPIPNYLLSLDSTGKFPASVISGAVGEATNADTVDGIHANTITTANHLYPLNTNAKFPASILEGIVADADKLDGKDSSEFSLLSHFHTLMDLTDVTSNLRAAFLAAGTAGASGSNRLATVTDIGSVSGLWTDEGTYIYPNNVGSGFKITDTGNLIVNGKVGIGTINPVRKLHVLSSAGDTFPVRIESSDGGAVLEIYAAEGSNDEAEIDLKSSFPVVDQKIWNLDSGLNGGFSIRRISDVGDNILATPFYISPQGRVGIGTADPQFGLDINGATFTDITGSHRARIYDDTPRSQVGYTCGLSDWSHSGDFSYFGPGYDGGAGSELLTGDSVVLSSASNVANGIRIIAANNGTHNAPIIFATGQWYATAAERMRITSSGNVGIDTTAPNAKLHVNKDSGPNHTEVARFVATNPGAMPYITVGNSNTGGENAPTCGGGYFAYDSPTGTVRIGEHCNQPAIIVDAGNVGIGTMDHQGTLDVNGPIYQRGAVLHADYVFEPDYKLETIEEHNQFMWQEKHLKAVPKAAKTEEGQEIMEVGARNKGVLEELEKAHIYIAQLNERIKKLEEKIK